MALVSVTGENLAAAMLERVGMAAHAQAPIMAEAGRATARGIRGVPVRTGALARSIGVIDSGAYGFVVGSRGVPYAHFVFRGTQKMAARPPTVPDHIAQATTRALSASIVRA